MIGSGRIGQYWVSLCYLNLADGVVRVTCGEGDYCIGYRFSHDAFNSELNSRKTLDKEQLLSALTNKGVYFLVFRDERGAISKVYVGKAGERADEKLGVLNRIKEHCRDKYRDWDEAVVLTRSDNSLNATRVSFLEHEFHDMIKRFYGERMLSNDVTPSSSTPGERELNDLEKFANVHAPRMLAALGYTFLEERKHHRKTQRKCVVKSTRTASQNTTASATNVSPHKANGETFWVRFNDGTVISLPRAKDVFAKSIAKLGVGKVAKLGIKRLLSKDKSSFGSYVSGITEIEGWFLNTHSSTHDKIRRLREIASQLHVDLKIGNGIVTEKGEAPIQSSKLTKEPWKGKTQLAKLIAKRGGNIGAYGGILQYFAEVGAKVRKPCPTNSKWRKPLEDAGIQFDDDGYVTNWACAKNPL